MAPSSAPSSANPSPSTSPLKSTRANGNGALTARGGVRASATGLSSLRASRSGASRVCDVRVDVGARRGSGFGGERGEGVATSKDAEETGQVRGAPRRAAQARGGRTQGGDDVVRARGRARDALQGLQGAHSGDGAPGDGAGGVARVRPRQPRPPLAMGRVALLRANTEHAVAAPGAGFHHRGAGRGERPRGAPHRAGGALFLPALVDKCGHSMEAVREKFRKILRLIPGVYPASRLCGYLVRGLDSKIRRPGSRCWRSSRA